MAGRLAASARSNHSSSSLARARACLPLRSSSWPIITRFCSPVSSSSTDAYWPVRPICSRTLAGSRATSWPATRALPSSAAIRVARMRTAVVLPAPLGPSTPSTLPWRAARSTPSSAWVVPKRFLSPSASIAKSSCSPASGPPLTARAQIAHSARLSCSVCEAFLGGCERRRVGRSLTAARGHPLARRAAGSGLGAGRAGGARARPGRALAGRVRLARVRGDAELVLAVHGAAARDRPALHRGGLRRPAGAAAARLAEHGVGVPRADPAPARRRPGRGAVAARLRVLLLPRAAALRRSSTARTRSTR